MARPGCPATAACVLALLSCLSLPAPVSGEIDLFANYTYQTTSTETTNKETGEIENGDFSRFRQLYNLNASRRIFPNLGVSGGGVFELDDLSSSIDDAEIDSSRRTTRPFAELTLSTPLWSLGAGYRTSEVKRSGGAGGTRKDKKEEITGLVGWKPEGLPQFNVNYYLTNVSDEPRTLDRREDLVNLLSSYDWKGVSLNYSYTYDNRKNSLTGFTNLTQFHNGRLGVSRGLWENRLLMNTAYTINYVETEFPGGGSGTIPVTRSAGLFSLDNTPDDGPALASIPSLIDGNLAASAGVDLGTGGDQAVSANVGVDLGLPRPVDTIFLWVDRSLPAEVSAVFSWDVYTSPDNTDESSWTLHATVFPAPFGTFQNRFEITFPQVQTRYVKVVTRALTPVIPGASDFQHIFVTELEAFVTVSGEEGTTQTSTEHTYTLGLRWSLGERSTASYDLYFTRQETDPVVSRRTSVSNGAGIHHVFGPVFSGNLRLQRTDETVLESRSRTYNYVASLRASYLPTFTQTLTFTGTSIEEDEGSSGSNTVFLRNSAQLYSGWNADVDVGFSRSSPKEGDGVNSVLARILTSIVPNSRMSLNVNYAVTWSEVPDSGGASWDRRQTLDLDLFLVPIRTVSLFLRTNVIEQSGTRRVFQNYSASWSPFPDGALKLSFLYNEALRTEENVTERTIGPTLKLNINRRVIIDMAYSFLEIDSDRERTESRAFTSNVRVLL